jgi:aspartate/methionine/tyrosine aminotransferase
MKQHSWQKFGTSIFSVMTQTANKHGAINLAQGFPNFDGPTEIKNAASTAIAGSWNQYAPSAGLIELRELAAKRMLATSKLDFDPATEITVFSGATEALFCSFLAFFEEGDEIITFAPYFDCYPAGAFAVKARLKEVPLKTPTWEPDIEALAKAITPNTKALLINTPHNPTGRVFNRAELSQIAAIALKHNLLVMTDEVYDELVFDDNELTRFASLPGMRERTITITSTAKTYSVTGWKVGFTFAPKHLTDELRAVHQFTVFCSATPLQKALCSALALPDSYYTQLRREYTQRRDYLYKELTNIGFAIHKPAGTYFMCADYSQFSKEGDVDFAMTLAEKIGVAVIPTSVFFNEPELISKKQHYVRFAFCKDLETLQQGVERLKRLTKSY